MKPHEEYYLKACEALSKTPIPILKDRSDRDAVSVDAYARLITCIAFKNMVKGKRFIPVYDGSEYHYYVYAQPVASGSEFSGTYSDYWGTLTFAGARLEYRTRKLCEEGIEEFKSYYIDFFILKEDK